MKTIRDYEVRDVEISGGDGDASILKTRNWNLFEKWKKSIKRLEMVLTINR